MQITTMNFYVKRVNSINKLTKWCDPQQTHFENQQTILEYLPKKVKIRILIEHLNPTFINETQIEGIKITNPDPMIITESWTEGIKFERHKEESLISSQVHWRTKRRNKPHVFLCILI